MGNPNPGSLPECRLIILTKYNLTKYNRLLSVFSYVTVCRTKWILQQERAHVSSLLERCQCFPYEDVCLIFALGSVSRNTVPWAIFPNTLPREQEVYCIRAPPKRGRYWEIHPRRPRDFLRPERFPEGNLEGRGKSLGRRGWISQYLRSFGGAQTFSDHQFFYREWIRKSFPVDREGLTVLKSILPW